MKTGDFCLCAAAHREVFGKFFIADSVSRLKKGNLDFLSMKNLKNQFSRKNKAYRLHFFSKIDFSSFSSRENLAFLFLVSKPSAMKNLPKPRSALRAETKTPNFCVATFSKLLLCSLRTTRGLSFIMLTFSYSSTAAAISFSSGLVQVANYFSASSFLKNAFLRRTSRQPETICISMVCRIYLTISTYSRSESCIHVSYQLLILLCYCL